MRENPIDPRTVLGDRSAADALRLEADLLIGRA